MLIVVQHYSAASWGGPLHTASIKVTWSYRLTLSRRVWRFWRRCKVWCHRTASAVVYIPAAVYHYLAGLWRAQIAKVQAETGLRSAAPEAVSNVVVVDASERPILTGVVAADYHDKVE